MKISIVLYILLTSILIGRIAQINALKSEAKKAYQAGDYATAIEKYKYLIDSLKVNEDEIVLNLANAYFNMQDDHKAEMHYRTITASNVGSIRSVANQQLGVLANRKGKPKEALTYFKQALKSDPGNEDARYNYELLRKKLKEQENRDKQNRDKQNRDKQNRDKQNRDKQNRDKQNRDKQNRDKQNRDKQNRDKQNRDEQNRDEQNRDEQNRDKQNRDKQNRDEQNRDEQNRDKQNRDKQNRDEQGRDKQNRDKQDQEQQNQEQRDQRNGQKKPPPSIAEKLKSMNMSEQKARMILEAMKNREIQYLQQQRRKATKPKDRSKPDW